MKFIYLVVSLGKFVFITNRLNFPKPFSKNFSVCSSYLNTCFVIPITILFIMVIIIYFMKHLKGTKRVTIIHSKPNQFNSGFDIKYEWSRNICQKLRVLDTERVLRYGDGDTEREKSSRESFSREKFLEKVLSLRKKPVESPFDQEESWRESFCL